MAERYGIAIRFLGYLLGTMAAIRSGEVWFVLAYTLLVTEAMIHLPRLIRRSTPRTDAGEEE